ncbi:MAG: hypothetical protein CBC48_17105 [bacterium TMED88]|nr:hypothetical protein [Deltaproteobacteria bacterium]OUV24891.1 MAG: hypothetical protein CBC48_17105 [bacterium TMED88]
MSISFQGELQPILLGVGAESWLRTNQTRDIAVGCVFHSKYVGRPEAPHSSDSTTLFEAGPTASIGSSA